MKIANSRLSAGVDFVTMRSAFVGLYSVSQKNNPL